MFLNMDAVRRYVNVTAAQDQAGLEEDAATACQWVEDEAGPIAQRTVTERAWSTGGYLRLAETPSAVTSIDGATDLPDLAIVPGGAAGAVAAGWHLVVYEAGAAEPPSWAVGAAMARTKQLWQIRLGAKGSQGGIDYGARAEALLAAHRRGPRP
jgi:hypothetical protein